MTFSLSITFLELRDERDELNPPSSLLTAGLTSWYLEDQGAPSYKCKHCVAVTGFPGGKVQTSGPSRAAPPPGCWLLAFCVFIG